MIHNFYIFGKSIVKSSFWQGIRTFYLRKYIPTIQLNVNKKSKLVNRVQLLTKKRLIDFVLVFNATLSPTFDGQFYWWRQPECWQYYNRGSLHSEWFVLSSAWPDLSPWNWGSEYFVSKNTPPPSLEVKWSLPIINYKFQP